MHYAEASIAVLKKANDMAQVTLSPLCPMRVGAAMNYAYALAGVRRDFSQVGWLQQHIYSLQQFYMDWSKNNSPSLLKKVQLSRKGGEETLNSWYTEKQYYNNGLQRIGFRYRQPGLLLHET